MSPCEPSTPQERAAWVAWRIARGWEPTTREVASATGLTPRGARYLLERVTRVCPVAHAEERWRAVERGR